MENCFDKGKVISLCGCAYFTNIYFFLFCCWCCLFISRFFFPNVNTTNRFGIFLSLSLSSSLSSATFVFLYSFAWFYRSYKFASGFEHIFKRKIHVNHTTGVNYMHTIKTKLVFILFMLKIVRFNGLRSDYLNFSY